MYFLGEKFPALPEPIFPLFYTQAKNRISLCVFMSRIVGVQPAFVYACRLSPTGYEMLIIFNV